MSERGKPVFLARSTYRRRRVIDASRGLPFLGAFLFLLPVLWNRPGAEPGTGPGLAEQGLYLFGVWAMLVLASAAISWRLGRGILRRDGMSDEGGDTP